MNDTADQAPPKIADQDPGDPAGGLWPSPDYARQVEQLRCALGETIYLAELEPGATQLGIRLADRPYVLLGVIDFPRPDPTKGLAPHLILLDDGRGVNLGRIARIARRRPRRRSGPIERRDPGSWRIQRLRAVASRCPGRRGATDSGRQRGIGWHR
jgi:hypothetical protein